MEPNALEVQYDLDGGPWVGSWFSGRNRKEGREWISRSEMVEATPGRRFSYVVGGTEDGIVRWTWTFTASGTGTVVEQSWQVLRLDPVLGTSRPNSWRFGTTWPTAARPPSSLWPRTCRPGDPRVRRAALHRRIVEGRPLAVGGIGRHLLPKALCPRIVGLKTDPPGSGRQGDHLAAAERRPRNAGAGGQ